jgi:diguanylate cyclase (GGDEF)-like protein
MQTTSSPPASQTRRTLDPSLIPHLAPFSSLLQFTSRKMKKRYRRRMFFPRMYSAPDSPNGSSKLDEHFDPELEHQYQRAVLANNRSLIRITSTTVAGLLILRGIEQSFIRELNPLQWSALAAITAISILLATVSWIDAFERLYQPLARAIVPLRNAVVGSAVAIAASRGDLEMLMVLPLAVIGPFFLMGLGFRTGLISGAAATLSFTVGALLVPFEPLAFWRTESFLAITLLACAVAARELESRSRHSFLSKKLVERLAQQDALTGLQNRRMFDEHLRKMWTTAMTTRRRMAILLIDVDHFKAYNDLHGHQAGDQTLRTVADLVRTFVDRPDDLLARYGGEEFAAILYDVDEDLARHTAECMRVSVAQANIKHRGSPCAERVTVSIGVGIVEPNPGRAPQGLLQLADQALYDAKRQGRNQIVVMNDEDYRMLVTGTFEKRRSTGTRT